ncbi:SH3 domain and tetratricopeptide repeat-containing protein 2 isoform X1 [Amia ocellicauda]|uniref:SH3 domain and tetratricopeptide repeat-containing protein 2 isoform X1 n=1 Tax=Amia ocellicauda TaxID=2972642 RepID=UPI003463F4DF
MTTGDEDEAPDPDRSWQWKESPLGGSTVSLAVGERFSSDVLLAYSARRSSTALPDPALQEALRTRLRVVESNSQDITRLFKDLSARLVSVHAEKDSFVITFKTVEEIWKFSTYLALGYVSRCLENFLCAPSVWLDSAVLQEVQISVTVDEEHLATMYLGLLLQEGSFFAKALFNSNSQDEEDLPYRQNDLVMVRDIGQDTMWEGILLATGQHGLVPVHAMQPLPYPFYQWFLRKYPGNAGGPPGTLHLFDHPIGTGTCVAEVDNSPTGADELTFRRGDLIEIVGFLVSGLDWFIGRLFSSGRVGFVQKTHAKPESFKPLDRQLVFLSEEERASLSQFNPCSDQCYAALLGKLLQSDISTVYRLDRLDKTDFAYIQNQPKPECRSRGNPRESLVSTKSESAPCHSTPRQSMCTSPSLSEKERENEALSFSFEDTFREMDEFEEDPRVFLEENSWEGEEAEALDPMMTLLNQDCFSEHLQGLYDLPFSFLKTSFSGTSEDELLQHLEAMREGAKRGRMHWAHRRVCFLLGRVCARKQKFSQARVYFEEALAVAVPGFADPPLLVALYASLTAVYLKQRMTSKLSLTLEKANALLLCLPQHSFCSVDECEVLKLVLRKAIVTNDRHLEARACYLMMDLFLTLGKMEEALPFVERLQFLTISLSAEAGLELLAPVDLNWMLSRLYHKKYLPYLSLASMSLDSHPSRSLQDAFQKIDLFVKNSGRLSGQWREGDPALHTLPAQLVVYLQQALTIASQGDDLKIQRDLCLSLASLYQQHGALDQAVDCAKRAVVAGSRVNEEEAFQASVLLAWLLLLTEEPGRATAMLQPLLLSLHETDSPTQRGVVHNLLAMCLRKAGQPQEAGRHFLGALRIAQESGNRRNQALALANFGCLALSVGAPVLAERFLSRSLVLFSELLESPTDAEHVQVYLWLGRSYGDRDRVQDVRLCYELGLLIAITAKNLHSQLVVAKALSSFYTKMQLHGQCIIYCEHCVSLSRDMRDKRLEGEFLETLSELYLSLNTDKSSRKSLDYTKQSLRISIDLGKRREESETWLQVGRIYYVMQEDELAEMYFQAAVKTALRVSDFCFAMSIYEEAGDVYFTGQRNRSAALPFYRDGALPFARRFGDAHSEFRLLSKLTELLMNSQQSGEALQYASLAVRISTTTGDRLKERVAFHRLATVYFSLQQFEMAENYYLKALSLSPPVLQSASEARYFVKTYCRLGDLTLHRLKDAVDAMGYFQLALAAALEDRGDTRALYIVYMKLAEIHGRHLPDKELCQGYISQAQALRKELSGDASSET